MLLAAATTFKAPYFDYHALAPEIVLTGVDRRRPRRRPVVDETRKYLVDRRVAGLGLLGVADPDRHPGRQRAQRPPRSMFGGAYVVDAFALVLKALFLVAGYVVLLMSTNYIEEGDYYEGEFCFLLLCVAARHGRHGSARDLITIFVALELLSIPALPAGRLAQARPQEQRGGDEVLPARRAGHRRDALRHVADLRRRPARRCSPGSSATATRWPSDIEAAGRGRHLLHRSSASRSRSRRCRSTSGRPTPTRARRRPVTAFLSVASKAAGFVALLELVFVGFLGRHDVVGAAVLVLAALTMTVGNLIALRQTNIVRMLAYSSIAQAGFILVPFAVAGDNLDDASTAPSPPSSSTSSSTRR